MKTVFTTFVTLLISISLFAKKDPVLMEINGNPVTKSEFEYIYNKNNSSNALDKKTLEEYVDLFVNFKLKVEEAKAKGIDTSETFITELNGYREQLTRPYLNDPEAEQAVVLEAYERMKEDLEVSHILLRVTAESTPADTLEIWNKAQEVIARLKTEDFAEVAKEVSEDEAAEDTGGYLGWITGFRTIYPFETMAYNTPVGQVSQPARTVYGYHIIKVHNRRFSQGEILTAHIMKFTNDGEEELNAKAKAEIDSLYQLILAGENFGLLAEKHSDDKASAQKKGQLPWFGTGRMVAEFETAAFALENKDDVSEPIQSPYGWHIIQLLDIKGIPSYESKKDEIGRMVKRDERADVGRKSFVKKLKKEYKFKEQRKNYIADFYELLDGKTLEDSVFKADLAAAELNKPMFKFAKKKYTQDDFRKYLQKNRFSYKVLATEIIDDKYTDFVEAELIAYEDSQLEKKHDDFRLLMQEYHDGILLFEVSNEEVWEKASKDTEGLTEFFNKNRDNYQNWKEPRFKGRVIHCKNEETYVQAQTIVSMESEENMDKELRQLNDSTVNIKYEKSIFLKGDNKHVDKQVFKTNAEVEQDEKFPYVLVVGNLIDQPEEYTDVRGLVTADYQEYLEEEWIKYLREKYPVVINEKVLRKVQKN